MTAQDEGTAPALQGVQLVIAIIVIAAANFMSFLDMTIANVALPHIAGALGVTPDEGVWAITSYAVAEAISVPLTGWVSARFGTTRVFVVSSMIFGVFSLVCGLSTSLGILVVARIAQGLAGGFLIPTTQILLQAVVPPKKANIAIAVWGMTALVAPIFGPVLGGYFCDSLSWSWCFFVNIPVAILCVLVPPLLLPKDKPADTGLGVDGVGLGLLILWVGALQIALDTGERQDWFESSSIAILVITAGVGLTAFVIWELTDAAPIVDLKVFRHRAFAVATVVMFIAYGSMTSFNVVFVLWLENAKGYPAIWAGWVMAFMAISGTFATPVISYLMSRVDPRLLISGGLMVVAASFMSRVGYISSIPFDGLILGQVMIGTGGTLFFLPIMGIATASVNKDEIASAAGLFNFARTMSLAFGSATGIAVWGGMTKVNHAELVGALNTDAVTRVTSQDLSLQQAAIIDSLVQNESVLLAVGNYCLLLGIACGAAALLIWLVPRPDGPLEALPAH